MRVWDRKVSVRDAPPWRLRTVGGRLPAVAYVVVAGLFALMVGASLARLATILGGSGVAFGLQVTSTAGVALASGYVAEPVLNRLARLLSAGDRDTRH